MTYSELCRSRLEHLEKQGPPQKPTHQKVAEYAHLHGISIGEAWEEMRKLHAKETAAYRVLVNSLKNYL